MKLTIELPQELQHDLTAEAEALGLPLSEYALRLLLVRPPLETMPRTGAELVAYWQRANLFGARPAIEDSQAYARRLRREAESRSRT